MKFSLDISFHFMYDSFTVTENIGVFYNLAGKGVPFMEKYEAPTMDVEELEEDIVTSSGPVPTVS